MNRLLLCQILVAVVSGRATPSAQSFEQASAPYGRLPHGPGFRNVREYGAKGDGVTDDTQAFIRALESGRGHRQHKSPANVYIPPGTYVISDTLIVWRATLLTGDASRPPTLLLKDHAPGFDDSAKPKPVLVTACGYEIDPASRDWTTRTDVLGGSTNNTFYITVQHLEIKIGPGNPGAWNIYWFVAQQTALRNVTIDAGTAQGCLKSSMWGGGGVISHLRLIGGDYGWYVDETSQWVLRSVAFELQRKHSLWLNGIWSFSLLDLKFRDTAPMTTHGGAVTLLNSSFDNIAGGSAIQSSGTSLVLQDVTSFGNREIVGGMLRAGPQGKTRVRLWVNGSVMKDGSVLPTGAHDLSGETGRLPENLPSPEYPVMTPATRSITELGAKGDGKTDNTAVIQQALDAGGDWFVPEGTYLISDTLHFRSHSRLFGEMWSWIVIKPDSPGFGDAESRKPIIATSDDPTARTTVCHLMFRIDCPGGIFCEWRAGDRSTLIDTYFHNSNRNRTLSWRISGAGGGLFENLWNPGDSRDGLEITSNGRKWLYAVAQEHYTDTAIIVRGAKNLVGLCLQFECSPRYVTIERSERIWLYQTLAGNWVRDVPSLIDVADSSNVAMFNSTLCQAVTVVAERPHGWNASERPFTRQTVWLIGTR